MTYKIIKKDKKLKGSVQLPASKSISNRLLILQALAKNNFGIYNLSESKDTRVLIEGLQSNNHTIDIGHAGTSMRFLTAYFSLIPGKRVLTGSERMKNRPIEKLVHALRQLGAEIEYLEKEGFPPLKITGGKINTNKAKVDGSISSQYITALLLIAPAMPDGLHLTIENRLVSRAYVQMTLNLMEHMGINYEWNDSVIIIPPQPLKERDIRVEADWSAASYWYQMAALADEAEINIDGLEKASYQGDAVVAKLFERFGVYTRYERNRIYLSRMGEKTEFFSHNFLECPDLVQTLATTCVLTESPFRISGAETLRIKETDRIAALQQELAKFNAGIKETSPGVLKWEADDNVHYSNQKIKTYDDHRMAMAFAPAALRFAEIVIEDPEVVVKSYPRFWQDLQNVGFEIEEQ